MPSSVYVKEKRNKRKEKKKKKKKKRKKKMLPSIAIAGSSGHVGQHIAAAVVSTQVAPSFSRIILLSRSDPSKIEEQTPISTAVVSKSPMTDPSATTAHSAVSALKTAPQGPTPVIHRQYSINNLVDALQDVSVVVDAIGTDEASNEFKDCLVKALDRTPVQLYIPSEFGVDHYVHDFSHAMWNNKKKHFALAERVLSPKQVKICRIFCGLFLEDSIGPWFGFDTRNGIYESIGSAEKGVSYTAMEDLGKTVAELAARVDPASSVPSVLHVGGDTRSMRQIASCMTACGAGKIEIREQTDMADFKMRAVHTPSPDPAQWIRFLMGEGKINHSSKGMGNDNNVVNPDQKSWKWKTLTALGNDAGGRPWKDIEWPVGAA